MALSDGVQRADGDVRGVRSGLQPAVFLDKDGTLVENVPFNVDPAQLRFTPHAIEGLKLLAAFDYRLVIVTNQPGIALGRFDQRALRGLEEALRARLAAEGIVLDGFYACPHAPVSELRDPAFACPCRKPAPGLLLAAAQSHGIDLARSWMVGDILDDVEAGRRAGCRTLLMDVGNETEWRYAPQRVPHGRVADLFDAARRIVAHDLEHGLPQERLTCPIPSRPLNRSTAADA
ncbi:MAG: HAD family hydrolase [Burkholderiaceae bacterium]|jgi:histidinol-phosphate phosphatase family protein|nr:HAD family hydrolase [Burkholderiaceae bacterium]